MRPSSSMSTSKAAAFEERWRPRLDSLDGQSLAELLAELADLRSSRDEASAYIEQLQGSAEHPPHEQASVVGARPRLSAAEKAISRLSTEQLAAELQRRGWIVIEP